MSSGPAASDSRSISRDFEMSEFWQNRHARLCPRGAERQHARTGIKLVQWLLFDGVDAETSALAIGRKNHLAVTVFADKAKPAITRTEVAIARTQITDDSLGIVLIVVPPTAEACTIGKWINSWWDTNNTGHGIKP